MPTILAIDDEQEFLDLVHAMMESLKPDYKVLTAGSGKEGIELAKSAVPDTILLDIAMPELDGYEVCRRLKADPTLQHIPVIFFSGMPLTSEVRIKGFEVGVDAYLGKPFNSSELVVQVDSMLRLKEAEDELRKEKELLEIRVQERTRALMDSEAERRSLVANIPGMVYRAFPDWSAEIISGSQAICGYDAEEINKMERHWLSLILEEDQDEILAEGRSMSERSMEIVQQYRIKHKNGQTRWVEDHKISHFDSDGEFLDIDGVVYDITARKLAEEEIIRSHALIEQERNMFVGGPVVVFKWRPKADEPIVYVSRNVTSVLGYEVDELLSGEILYKDIIHSDDWAHVSDEVKEFTEKGIDNFMHEAYRLMKKDGDILWVTDYTTVIRDADGEVINYLGYVLDITSRKRAEQQLQETATKIRAINEASHTLARDLNLDSVVGHCANIARDMFETDHATIFLVNKQKQILEPLISIGEYAEEMMRVRLKVGEGFSGKIAESGKSKIANRIDLQGGGVQVPGTPEEPESLLGVPLLIQNEVIGTMILSKLGEEEFVEEDLRFVENLADISAVSIENARLFEDAVRAEKVKTLFLANMSHEIRTPLNSILGFTDLMQQTLAEKLGEVEEEYFKIIRQSSNRLMHTVHEILDISQIEAGTVELQPSIYDLNILVNALIPLYEKNAADKDIELRFNPLQEEVLVRIDEQSLVTALGNLIDNAVKYTEVGRVEISVKQQDAKCYLSIADTGIGMTAEYLDNIYEIFSQESEGYTKKYQGVGLGLAICKRCLDMNKVEVEVQSTPGKGTTFTLSFDKVSGDGLSYDSDSEPQPEESVEARSITGRSMVLIVEDDNNSQRLIQFYVEADYDTCCAASVDEARRELDRNQVDIILLDLSLAGGEDGLTLARELRDSEKWKNLPIIAVTAHAFTSDRDNVLASGCNEYLSKPVKQDILLEMMKRFLDPDPSST